MYFFDLHIMQLSNIVCWNVEVMTIIKEALSRIDFEEATSRSPIRLATPKVDYIWINK